MSIAYVKSEADFNDYVKNNKYLIANFTAQWCGPCRAIKPMVDEIYTNECQKVEIVRVDLDQNQPLAQRYQVSSIPTFIFIRDGQVVDKITGAGNLQNLFRKFAQMAEEDSSVLARAGNGSSTNDSSSNTDASVLKEITKYVPKGYKVLNSMIYGGDFEALNTLPLHKSASVKDVFDLNKSHTTILSDADSQMLLYVPLTHISKIYSVLIKTSGKPAPESDGLTVDSSDLEDVQNPNVIKVWGNKLNILSFDDAASNSTPQHLEALQLPEEGWYECKLKFVRFQNVQSLNMFFDGDDDDAHTLIEKIVVIGIGGEEKDHHSMMEKLTGEEH